MKFTPQMVRRVASRHISRPGGLDNLLGILHGVYWLHWTLHWQSTSYEDHLLFERLYGALPAEIDGLAEKMVQLHGVEAVEVTRHVPLMAAWLARWQDTDPVSRALEAERALLAVVVQVQSAEDVSLGLDDYLAGVANTHETHLYLLQQRMGGIMRTASVRPPPGYRQIRADKHGNPVFMKGEPGEDGTTLIQMPAPKVYSDRWALSMFQVGRGWGRSIGLDPALGVQFKSPEEAARYRVGSLNGNGKPDLSAEGQFFDRPRSREMREFAQSGALSNDHAVSQVAIREGEGTRKLQEAVEDAPLTVDEVLDETPGSTEFSTLSRYIVQTVHPTDPGVPQSRDDIPKHPNIK